MTLAEARTKKKHAATAVGLVGFLAGKNGAQTGRSSRPSGPPHKPLWASPRAGLLPSSRAGGQRGGRWGCTVRAPGDRRDNDRRAGHSTRANGSRYKKRERSTPLSLSLSSPPSPKETTASHMNGGLRAHSREARAARGRGARGRGACGAYLGRQRSRLVRLERLAGGNLHLRDAVREALGALGGVVVGGVGGGGKHGGGGGSDSGGRRR